MKRLWIMLWLALLPLCAGAIDRSEIQLARSAARQHGGDVEWYLLITQTLQEAGLKDIEIFYRLFNHWASVSSSIKNFWIEEITEDDEISDVQRAFLLRNVNWFAFIVDLTHADTFSSADIRRKFGSELDYVYRHDFRPYTLRFTALLRDEEWRAEVHSKIMATTGKDLREISGELRLFGVK